MLVNMLSPTAQPAVALDSQPSDITTLTLLQWKARTVMVMVITLEKRSQQKLILLEMSLLETVSALHVAHHVGSL